MMWWSPFWASTFALKLKNIFRRPGSHCPDLGPVSTSDKIVRSHKASKPRDLYLEVYDCSKIWQAPRQQGCRGACQISKWCHNLSYQSSSYETSQDLSIRHRILKWGPGGHDLYDLSNSGGQHDFMATNILEVGMVGNWLAMVRKPVGQF